MFFEKNVDMRSRKAMSDFLAGHYRYSTMNRWNNGSSYAHCVKIHRLGLTKAQESVAWEILDTDYWGEISFMIEDFTEKMCGEYTIGSNGRSSGYLVLYNSRFKNTDHKSRCTSCGQLNFEYALTPDTIKKRTGIGPGDQAWSAVTDIFHAINGVADVRHRYDGKDIIEMVESRLEGKSLQGYGVARVLLEHVTRTMFDLVKGRTTLGNECGMCRKNTRHNLEAPIRMLETYPGQSIDQGEYFSEWTMDALRSRVKLVRRFDRACDGIRDYFIDLCENSKVVEETISVPKRVKVLERKAA